MNKFIKNTVAIALSLMTLTSTVPALANQTLSEGSANTIVKLDIGDSGIIVGVPTCVIVSGTPNATGQYIGKYSVSVEGDMSGDKVLNVAPDSSTVELIQNGKDNVTAFIEQEQTAFSSADLSNKTVVDGTITASDLTAGSWNGKFAFNIGYDKTGVPAGYSVLYKYDLSATSNDDVAAYYCVPNENTAPIATQKSFAGKVAQFAANALSLEDESGQQIIELNGVSYTLSDQDKLIISGTGKMKENIQADFYNYAGLYADVAEHFELPYHVGVWELGLDEIYYIQFEQNSKKANCFYHYRKNVLYTGEKSYNGITIDDVNAYIDTVVDKYATMETPKTVIIKDGITNVSKNAFNGCSTLEVVSLPNSIKTIDERAFSSCVNLVECDIPESVTTIGGYAFYKCSSLTKLDLSRNDILNRIDRCAFQQSGVVDAILNDNTVYIEDFAFNGCKSLKSINLPKNLYYVNQGILTACTALEDLYFNCDSPWFSIAGSFGPRMYPQNVYYKSVDQLKSYNIFTTYELNATNTTNLYIGGKLIKDAINLPVTSLRGSSIETLRISRDVTVLPSEAYRDCKNLKEVYIHGDLKGMYGHTTPYFGDYTFYGLAQGSVIYCETQQVADALNRSKYVYESSKTTVVVDATKF